MPTTAPIPALREADFEPQFVAAWRLAASGVPQADLRQDAAWTAAVREVHPQVFTLRLLRPQACARLLAQIDAARDRALAGGGSLAPPAPACTPWCDRARGLSGRARSD